MARTVGRGESITRDPGSVLVVPFADGIGDFVMLLPLLRHVRARFPRARITVAASARSALLLDEGDPSRVRTPSWLRDRPKARGGPLRRLIPQSLLARLAGLVLRPELGRHDLTLNLFLWWERDLDFARHWTPQVPATPGAVHTLDALAERLAWELGAPLPVAARAPWVGVRTAAARWAEAWWPANAGGDDAPVVALVPQSNMRIKRWPLQYWAALVDALAAAGARPLLVVPPGAEGTALARALAELVAHTPGVLQAPLDCVAAVLTRCALTVGVDTGLLHLAAAVGTRYVGLFGPTNPLVTGPYQRWLGESLVAPFAKAAACRGCWQQFKYIDDRCAALGTPSCMAHLPPDAVIAAAVRQLALAATPSRLGEASPAAETGQRLAESIGLTPVPA